MDEKKIMRDGKEWTIRRVRHEDAEEADFRFWYEGMTPGERVEAVGEATMMCLMAQGITEEPRLQRVHRRIKCPWGPLSHRGGARGGALRPGQG